MELEGREAKLLRSLDREGCIDKVIGKQTEALILWIHLLSGAKERYPFQEDIACHPGKWTTMKRGIQHLMELSVLEVICNNTKDKQLPTDPAEV